MTRREVPEWVVNAYANGLDPLPFGTHLVLKRDGVVIDRWPSDLDFAEGTSDRAATLMRRQSECIAALAAPNPVLAQWMATLPESGFWRDAGHGVEQWVVPR